MKNNLLTRLFSMTDEVWARHANPLSVWTRLIILPFIALSIWFRDVLGGWTWLLVGGLIVWTWLNPRFFAKPKTTHYWASKAVLGERVWLNKRQLDIPQHHKVWPHVLNLIAACGLPFLVFGLWQFDVANVFFGLALTILGKMWFLDRMVWLYEDMKEADPVYRSWLY